MHIMIKTALELPERFFIVAKFDYICYRDIYALLASLFICAKISSANDNNTTFFKIVIGKRLQMHFIGNDFDVIHERKYYDKYRIF